MRHAFDLPVLKYQDSIFAYFFYRLLQRAKNIVILYDNLGSSNRSGELSRFVYQLELESGFEITRLQFVQNVKLIGNYEINIIKSKPILDKLKQFVVENGESKKQLTASSLDTYMNCPFQFYLKYIAGIKEQEKVEEKFSPVEMGLIIHATMEYLLKTVIESKGSYTIDKQDFKQILDNIDSQIKNAFLNHLNIGNPDEFEYTGNLLIVKEVIKKYLTDILRYDEQRAPFEIIQLEGSESFKSDIEIEQQGKKIKIGIKGIIDRIDKIGNKLYVIDYKTGKADKEFSSIEELFNPESEKRKKAITQLMFYSVLVKENLKFSEYAIKPHIYDIRNMYKKSFDPAIKLKIDKERNELKDQLFNDIMIEYKCILSNLIQEIFNPDTCFSQTEIPENCKYCVYKPICGKEG
jgi:ATP-dependent helicase/DNAse subunit B